MSCDISSSKALLRECELHDEELLDGRRASDQPDRRRRRNRVGRDVDGRAAVAARYGADHAAAVAPGAPRHGAGCDDDDEVLVVECGAVSAPGARP